jgi:hypothetical protein
MTPNNPCRFCEQRTPDCHGHCVEYKSWAANRRAEAIATSKQKSSLDKMWNYGWRKTR